MLSIDDGQKKAIGLSFLTGELLADSPFGMEKLKKPKIYGRHEKEALLVAHYNVAQVVAFAGENLAQLDKVRRLLMRLKNIRNSLTKCEHSYLHEVELFEVKNFLLTFSKLLVEFETMNAVTAFKGIIFTDMTPALDILDPQQKRVAPFSLSDMNSPTLWAIRKEKVHIEGLIYAEKSPEKVEALKFERTQIVAKEEEEETRLKKALSKSLVPFLPDFYANIEQLGNLDATIQKGLLARKYGAICPTITEGESIYLENMFNPQISEILKQTGKTFTPVSITLSQGTTILTGANMGGKSVALKTAVLNVILCQMGFFVFAEKAELPLFDGVHLISEDLQSIHKGLSTFGAEMLRLNDILKSAKDAFLFIALDELARGTNPEEGAIIVKAVARYMHGLESICLLTTHYDNIVEDGFNHYQVAGLSNLDFAAMVLKNSAHSGVDLIAQHMDYRLVKADGRKDPPKDALNICKLLALDTDVLEQIERLYTEK